MRNGVDAIRYIATIAAPVPSRMLQDSIMHESQRKFAFFRQNK